VCRLKSVPFRGVNCSDAAGRQFGYSEMMTKVKQSFTGTLWDSVARSPYATYKVKPSFIGETYLYSFHVFHIALF